MSHDLNVTSVRLGIHIYVGHQFLKNLSFFLYRSHGNKILDQLSVLYRQNKSEYWISEKVPSAQL